MMFFRLFCTIALALVSLATAGSARAAAPLETYGHLPALEMAALSRSGDRVALIGIVGDQRRLIVIDRANKPLLSMDVGDFKIRSVQWAGDDKVLVHLSRTSGLGAAFRQNTTEVSSMLVVPIGGKPAWQVFGNVDSITGGIRGFFGTVERDGHWYGYFGGMTLDGLRDHKLLTNTHPALYRVDLDSRETDMVARRTEGEGVYRDWVIGADGKIVAYLDFLSGSGVWNLHDNRTTIASGRAPTGAVGLLSLGRTADTVLYVTRNEDGEERLFEQPIAGGAATELLGDEALTGYHIDNRTRLFIGYVRDGDTPEDQFFDKRLARTMAAARKAFPGLSVELVDKNDAFDRLLVKTSGPSDPETWWLVDIKGGGATILGVGYRVDPIDVGPMRMFRYKAADGLEMAGVLTLPAGREAKNLPVVILPHGGPHARNYPVFDWWPQALASRGYAVFQPNFRGSTGLGGSFRMAGNGEWGRKMQTDISDGLAALAREGIVDPKRACIVGGSYGGYAALAGVTVQQGLYRCAVSVAGVADLSRLVSTDVYQSGSDLTMIRALKEEMGSGVDLKQFSPVTFTDRADAPVLLIHGVDDTVVPFVQSRIMASALERSGKPVEFVTLKGEDHWLSKSETRLTMLKATVAFVEKYNPPDPPPPAK